MSTVHPATPLHVADPGACSFTPYARTSCHAQGLTDAQLRAEFADLHAALLAERQGHQRVRDSARAADPLEAVAALMREAEDLSDELGDTIAWVGQEAGGWLGEQMTGLLARNPALRGLTLALTGRPFGAPNVHLLAPRPTHRCRPEAQRFIDAIPPVAWWVLLGHSWRELEARAETSTRRFRLTATGTTALGPG